MTEPEQAMRRLRTSLGQEKSLPHDQPGTGGWLQRMCRAAARDLPASGVGVSLVDDEGGLMTAAASDPVCVLVEELQFTMGEGPCLAAYASRRPVLVPDLGAMAVGRWPGYTPAAREHGVRAVFAFPLQVGVARFGAMDVYRQEAGAMTPAEVSMATVFAELAMEELLEPGSDPHRLELGNPGGTRYEVYQAQGMVMVQLGVSAEEALVRLRAHAFAAERRLSDVARDVIERRLYLDREPS